MSEGGIVESLLAQHRSRLVGSIMQHAEREIYPSLTPAQRQAFRTKVLGSVGVFYDFTLDTVRAMNTQAATEGVQLNEVAMRMLGEIHGAITKDP